MDARAIRTVILDGLEAGAIWQAGRSDFREAFLAGSADVPVVELDMDSLARMELCIAIEIGTGVSLAPEELDRYRTLAALAGELEGRLRG